MCYFLFFCVISYKSVGKSDMKFVVMDFDGEAATVSLSEPVHGPAFSLPQFQKIPVTWLH